MNKEIDPIVDDQIDGSLGTHITAPFDYPASRECRMPDCNNIAYDGPIHLIVEKFPEEDYIFCDECNGPFGNKDKGAWA